MVLNVVKMVLNVAYLTSLRGVAYIVHPFGIHIHILVIRLVARQYFCVRLWFAAINDRREHFVRPRFRQCDKTFKHEAVVILQQLADRLCIGDNSVFSIRQGVPPIICFKVAGGDIEH